MFFNNTTDLAVTSRASLRQLATTFEVTVDPTFTHNPEVTHVQFVDPTEVLASHRLYLSPDSGQLVQLAYSWHGHRQSVGLVNLGTGLTTIIAAQNQYTFSHLLILSRNLKSIRLPNTSVQI